MFISAPSEYGPSLASSTTIDVAQLADAVASGAIVIDIRSHRQRQHQGVLPGALAVEAREATALIAPGTRCAYPP